MDYEDMIEEMYADDEKFEEYYDSRTPAQQAVIDDIIARKELTEDEYNELIDDPAYYKGEENGE